MIYAEIKYKIEFFYNCNLVTMIYKLKYGDRQSNVKSKHLAWNHDLIQVPLFCTFVLQIGYLSFVHLGI